MEYINRKQLAVILECHRHTASKMYSQYLEEVDKKPFQRLTIDDVSRIEKRRAKDIKDMLF